MELLGENELSLSRIARILEDAYMEVDKSDEGRLWVDAGDCRVIVFFEEEKKLVTFASIWGLKPTTELRRFELVNKLNDEMILVRFSAKRETVLWCDQQFSVKGGITPKWLILTLKRFAEVCAGAAKVNSEYFE